MRRTILLMFHSISPEDSASIRPWPPLQLLPDSRGCELIVILVPHFFKLENIILQKSSLPLIFCFATVLLLHLILIVTRLADVKCDIHYGF